MKKILLYGTSTYKNKGVEAIVQSTLNQINTEENTIKDEYGFSKEDAIAVVKKSYNSDNYEFSAKAREDNKYIVTVKNTETGSTYQYVVDPNDGSFSTLEN